MKNLTRIGASLLGTWTAQTRLSTSHGDTLEAYFVAHFMPDPRSAHSCSLADCHEIDNRVCVMTNDDGHAKKVCRDISEEKDVSWSDLTAFFYFGVKVDSPASPKARLEFSTGDWIGPWNLIMAEDTDGIVFEHEEDNLGLLVDKYVSRYVQSQSVAPAFLQDIPPAECSLYNKQDDFAAFLGSSSLEHMAHVQTNFSITNDTMMQVDPYAPYLQTCNHGNVQPILPQLELEFVDTNANSSSTNHSIADGDDDSHMEMELKFRYKIMAVPSPDEQAYRILPQLQSKFQGQGGYNIIAGPYCYGDDPRRGYSFDLNFNTAMNSNSVRSNHSNKKDTTTFVRGCVDGYPCVPPAAMGIVPVIPANNSCDNDNHHRHNSNNGSFGGPNLILSFACYGLAMALLISTTFNCHLSHQHKEAMKKHKQRERHMEDDFAMIVDNHLEAGGAGDHGAQEDEGEEKPLLFGAMNLLKGGGISPSNSNQNEDVGPFGDLDQAEGKAEDPLKEQLLPGNKME